MSERFYPILVILEAAVCGFVHWIALYWEEFLMFLLTIQSNKVTPQSTSSKHTTELRLQRRSLTSEIVSTKSEHFGNGGIYLIVTVLLFITAVFCNVFFWTLRLNQSLCSDLLV